MAAIKCAAAIILLCAMIAHATDSDIEHKDETIVAATTLVSTDPVPGPGSSHRGATDSEDDSKATSVLEPTEQLGEEAGFWRRRRRTFSDSRRRRSAADIRANKAEARRKMKAAEDAYNKKNEASMRKEKSKLQKAVDKDLAAAVPITRFKCSSFSENPDKWIVRLGAKEEEATRTRTTSRTLLGSNRRRSPPRPAPKRPEPMTFVLVLASSFILFSRSSSHSSAIFICFSSL